MDRQQAVLKMWAQGRSLPQIGTELGITGTAVAKILRQTERDSGPKAVEVRHGGMAARRRT